MKNKLRMLLVLCLALILTLVPVTARAAGNLVIDEKSFPDEVFREYVRTAFDTDSDGELRAEEIASAKEIDLAKTEVADLTGLSVFTALKSLDVSDTAVGTLNIARNTALETLRIGGSAVKTLDVSKNTALKELDVSGTPLTALNVARNTALETLIVSGCPLKALDVTGNTKLTELRCDGIKATTLNVSRNTLLRILDCSRMGLKTLDVTANQALEVLNCSENDLAELDVTAAPALMELRCRANRLKTLDVTANEALDVLDCGGNLFSVLDLSRNAALRLLQCEENLLLALDVSENPELEILDCSKNSLMELSVKANPALKWLNCSGNALEALNLSANEALEHLNCSENDIRRLSITECPALEWVECWSNSIHSLDISRCPLLLKVYKSGATVEYKRYTLRSYAQGTSMYEIGVDPDVILHDGSVPAPTIIAQPRDASAVEGKSVTFSVNAAGEGLIYRWYYRQPGNDRWFRLPGENGRKLTVTAEKTNNGYRYLCEVLNRGGVELSERVRLTVITKPTITTQPGNIAAPEGEKVTFMVVASGEALTYQWYRLTPNASEWDKVDSGTSAKLTLTATEAKDGTKYRCVVKNDAGKVTSAEAKLTTLYKPTITTQPQDATVAKGKNTTFTVKASGGHLRYQWYVKLKGETSWTLIKGATDRTLEVRGTPKKDNSTYRCKVYNAAGQTYSETVTLHVN